MWRSSLVTAVALAFALPLMAQQPGGGGKDDAKKLEVELRQLRERIQEVESKLKNAITRQDEDKKVEKRPDKSRPKEDMTDNQKGEPGKKRGPGFGKGEFGKGKFEGGFGKGPFGKGGFGEGFKGFPFEGKTPGWASDPEKMKEFRGLVEKARQQMDKKYPEERGKEPSADFERRLERLLREVEALRRELKERK